MNAHEAWARAQRNPNNEHQDRCRHTWGPWTVSTESRRLGYGDRLQVSMCPKCCHMMTRLVAPVDPMEDWP